MINTVRATVLSIANKNNYGYITPSDFNLYAKQAQLDIFEDYFYQYNSWIIKQNARVSGSEYADILKGLVEVIDSFSETRGLTTSGINLYNLPANYYLINKINYYPNTIFSSTTTAAGLNTLTDANATFTTTGTVLPGQFVTNTSLVSVSSGFGAYIVSVDSETQLTLSNNPFGSAATIGNSYTIITTAGIREVERVSQNKIFYLNSSSLTSPNISYPAYVLGGANNLSTGNTITVYPDTIIGSGKILSQYIRYPLDPNWSYSSLTGGEPVFDEGAADYQDFELPDSDEPNLVNKILQYAGVSLREKDIAVFGNIQEQEDNQQQS
tara:strand:+ start:530 stop:1504 length:975 start_codon:yes stop_codon:yes gene_type:complete